jgi:hypothetical protein
MSSKKLDAERFKDSARALGRDDDKDKFEATLAQIAAHKPKRSTGKPVQKRKVRSTS